MQSSLLNAQPYSFSLTPHFSLAAKDAGVQAPWKAPAVLSIQPGLLSHLPMTRGAETLSCSPRGAAKQSTGSTSAQSILYGPVLYN